MTLVGGALATWPRAARAQKGIKPAYIGFISGLDNAGAASFISAFREGLTARGYVEPGTLKIEAIFADSALDKIPAFVGELERRRVEMIVSLVEAGKEPPVPRMPLAASDPLWIAKELGLSARVAAILESRTK